MSENNQMTNELTSDKSEIVPNEIISILDDDILDAAASMTIEQANESCNRIVRYYLTS